jgi:hypothetical protein
MISVLGNGVAWRAIGEGSATKVVPELKGTVAVLTETGAGVCCSLARIWRAWYWFHRK